MRRLLLLLALIVSGCSATTATIRGQADDGENITGVANATGMWDASGVLQFIGNKGLSCVGRFLFEGVVGPNGKASVTCNNGETGEFNLVLTSATQPAGYGDGTIGRRKVHFTLSDGK